MTILAYVGVGALFFAFVIVLAISIFESPGDYMLQPIANKDGVEQYESRTPAGRAIVTRVHHPDLGERFKVETEFGGVNGNRTAYVPPTPQVVERWLTQASAEHLAAQALPPEA